MQQNIASVQQNVADDSSMQRASDELRNMANVTNLVKKKKNELADVVVSCACDGTWWQLLQVTLVNVLITE